MKIQLRRGTAAQWTTANPVLAAGEPAVETDTGFLKVGDGASAWTALPYAAIPAAQKGAANGVATLNGSGKLPVAQLPADVMEFKGVWNASTNTPALADGVGDPGDFYRVGTAGTRNLGSGSLKFAVGDAVILNSSLVWEKSSGAGTAAAIAVTPAGSLTQADVQAALEGLAVRSDSVESDNAAQDEAIAALGGDGDPRLRGLVRDMTNGDPLPALQLVVEWDDELGELSDFDLEEIA
jgi:hypothetical protein